MLILMQKQLCIAYYLIVCSLLLRGPFKDILLQFLVPRCRSAEDVDLIRSNLYVHGLRSSEPPAASSSSCSTPRLSKASKKNKELTSILAELEGKKIQEMEILAKTAADLNGDEESGVLGGGKSLEGNIFAKKNQLQELKSVLTLAERLCTELDSVFEADDKVSLL